MNGSLLPPTLSPGVVPLFALVLIGANGVRTALLAPIPVPLLKHW
jgi:hypothetical protein